MGMASVNKFWRKRRKSGEGKGREEEKDASATDGKDLHVDLEHIVSKRCEGKVRKMKTPLGWKRDAIKDFEKNLSL